MLDGGFGINIITKQLKLRLGLLKLKLAPYNLRMADQTTIKFVGLIKDLKIYGHGIPYIIMFNVLHNNVVDSNYSMLLGRPWLRDAKVAHDWGSNIVTIQGNGTVRIITVTKHLGGEVKKLEVFSIGTINLPKTIQFVKTIDVEIMDIHMNISISKQGSRIHSTKKKVPSIKYELFVVMENKVYLKTYYKHQLGSVAEDETPAKIKAQELQIVGWMLIEDQQLMKLNLGIDAKPQMVKTNAQLEMGKVLELE